VFGIMLVVAAIQSRAGSGAKAGAKGTPAAA